MSFEGDGGFAQFQLGLQVNCAENFCREGQLPGSLQQLYQVYSSRGVASFQEMDQAYYCLYVCQHDVQKLVHHYAITPCSQTHAICTWTQDTRQQKHVVVQSTSGNYVISASATLNFYIDNRNCCRTLVPIRCVMRPWPWHPFRNGKWSRSDFIFWAQFSLNLTLI